ncbi:S41 family peptidase [Sphingomicrobium arenosum]|uniref:S41 family peptidase n=1 Tax=Sphingomicrobium arenosum TaxID=2233861 RepID=UPI002240F21D|nr:S41 family peptidase [Sphingomicrobium arenosum]
MRADKFLGLVLASTMLASCGGGSGGTTTPPRSGGDGGGGVVTPPPTSGTSCSLSARKEWVLETLKEYYLYPDLVDDTVNPDNYTTLQSYIEALLAPAYAQKLDKAGFTYVRSIEEEEAQIANATYQDFGWRPSFEAGNALIVLETFENGPAYKQAGIDRGALIKRVGRTAATLTDPVTAYNNGTLIDLLFPAEDGAQTVVEFQPADYSNPGSYLPAQTVTLTASEYSLDPVSKRYGVEVIGNVGYVNLRTFATSNAKTQLSSAFAEFNSAGVDQIVVDLRYNGGGLVDVAEHFGDLLSEGLNGELFSETIYSDGVLRNYNVTEADKKEYFQTTTQQLQPNRLAFITTDRSASASELLANAFPPYFGDNTALVGSNTYGKAVGQIAIDREACDDRLRVIAFKTVNADGVGDYFDGLADTYPVTCRAPDDYTLPMGDAREDSIAEALDYMAGGKAVCTPMSASSGQTTLAKREKIILMPKNPTFAEQALYGPLR